MDNILINRLNIFCILDIVVVVSVHPSYKTCDGTHNKA